MAKASILIGRALILIGLTCFFNTSYSMIRCKYIGVFRWFLMPIVRRFAQQEGFIDEYTVPLDVKVEVIIGLLLCVFGTISIYTFDCLENIDLLYYYQNK